MRLSVLLCFVLASFATHGQRFSWGIKAGANVNDIYIVTDQPSVRDMIHPTTSFHGGLYGHLSMGRKFSFIPELQFIQKGFLIRNPVAEVKYRINYIEIPLLISYSVFKYLNIDVGQVNGFKISARKRDFDNPVLYCDHNSPGSFKPATNGNIWNDISANRSIYGNCFDPNRGLDQVDSR